MVACRSSEKNRFQNVLTVCNVALDSVVSDVFGKSATAIIDYLLNLSEDDSPDHQEISSMLLRSLKKKSNQVMESIEGIRMADSQKYRMSLIRSHLNFTTSSFT